MDFKELITELIKTMCGMMGISIITAILQFQLRTRIETRPMLKYNIDLFIYSFNVNFYYPLFSYVLPMYFITYSLFAPDYDTLPKFSVAWIAWGMGLLSAIVFSYLRKNQDRPNKPE